MPAERTRRAQSANPEVITKTGCGRHGSFTDPTGVRVRRSRRREADGAGRVREEVAIARLARHHRARRAGPRGGRSRHRESVARLRFRRETLKQPSLAERVKGWSEGLIL